MTRLALALALVAMPSAAFADPASLLISALGGSAALGAVGTALVRIGVGLAITAIAGARQRRADRDHPGIITESTTSGEATPQSFLLGRYATAGNLVAPAWAFGESGDTPNAFRLFVIDLSDRPVTALQAIWVNGTRFAIGTELTLGEGGGVAEGLSDAQDKYRGNLKVWFKDGTQTTAPTHLTTKIGSHPERPWTAQMVGTGIAFCTVQCKFDPDVFQGDPTLLFEVDGIALEDPRTSTTAFTRNPMVMAWNIFRGIDMGDGTTFGLNVPAVDLPDAEWHAAMDACDVLVDGEPSFRAGYEVLVGNDTDGGMSPFEVIDRLLDACDAQVCDVGGTWLVNVGGPGASVAAITDDDLLIDKAHQFLPFDGRRDTINTIRASRIDPDAGWQPTEMPLRQDATALAADGEELVAQLDLTAVTEEAQGQRLMQAWLADARRQRRHINLPLGPVHGFLQPFDAIDWTSGRNGYAAKKFEIGAVGFDIRTVMPTITLRERDPLDYNWSPSDELPKTTPSSVVVVPSAFPLPGFGVVPITLTDGAGSSRPALQLSWSASLTSISTVAYEVRLATGGAVVSDGSTSNVPAASLIVSDGILPATDYEVRARGLRQPTEWTAWVAVTTAAAYLGADDMSAQFLADQLAQAEAQVEILRQEAITAFGPLDPASSLASQITDLGTSISEQIAAVDVIERDLELAIPRELEVSETLRIVAHRLAALTLRLRETEGNLADAGLYIDQDLGQARLEAVSRFEGELIDVGITLNAIQGELTLAASRTYVDNAIASAVIDPAQVPVFTTLEARIATVEVDLDAAEADITSKAEVTDVDALGVRVTTAETDIDALDAAVALRVTTTDFTALDTRVTTAETTLDTIGGAGLAITLTDLREQAVIQGDLARVTLADMLRGFETREAARTDFAYLRQDMRALVDEDRASIATLEMELGAAFGNAVALISAETTARASDVSALASDITSLGALLATETTALEGQIDEINNVAVDSTSASALALYQLQLDVTAAEGDIAGQASSITALEGRVTVTEDGIEAESRRIGTVDAAVANAEDEAHMASLRAILLDREARQAVTSGAAQIREEAIAHVNEGNAATAALRSDLSAGLAGNLALITAETEARVEEDAAQVTRIETLEAVVNDPSTGTLANASAIATTTALVEDLDTGLVALSSNINQLSSDLGVAQANITDLSATRVTAAGAIAAVSGEVTAEYGSLSAWAQATSFAEARTAALSSGFLWRTRSGGASGEIELVAADNIAGGASSTFKVKADRLEFIGDFTTFFTDVQITGDLYVDGSITTGKLEDNATYESDAAQKLPAEIINSTSWVTHVSVSIDRTAAGPVLLNYTTRRDQFYLGRIVDIRILEGTSVVGGSQFVLGQDGASFSALRVARPTAGPVTYHLQLRRSGDTGNVTVDDMQLSAILLKK